LDQGVAALDRPAQRRRAGEQPAQGAEVIDGKVLGHRYPEMFVAGLVRRRLEQGEVIAHRDDSLRLRGEFDGNAGLAKRPVDLAAEIGDELRHRCYDARMNERDRATVSHTCFPLRNVGWSSSSDEHAWFSLSVFFQVNGYLK
jgi:hypothetical protein